MLDARPGGARLSFDPTPHDPTASSAEFGASAHDRSLDAPDLDLVEMECIRCRVRAAMRFYGLCPSCRDELRAKYDVAARKIETEAYEPKVNVTPNAVALKDG
jgi:hypothetical protein